MIDLGGPVSRDVLKLTSWTDAFPWLERAARRFSSSERPSEFLKTSAAWADSIEMDDPLFQVIVEEIAWLAISTFPHWRLGDLFPMISDEESITPTIVAGFTPASAPAEFDLRWCQIDNLMIDGFALSEDIEVNSVYNFVRSLARMNANVAKHARSEMDEGAEGRIAIVRRDPFDVYHASALSENPSSVAGKLSAFLSTFTLRDVHVIAGRLLSNPRRSLDEIGKDHGLTRERIRQLQGQLSKTVSEWFDGTEWTQALSLQIRQSVGVLCTLDALTEQLPELGKHVTAVSLPAWFVFDQFDDSFESDGTWVAVPSLKDVGERFDTLFDGLVGTKNFVALDELRAGLDGWGTATFDDLIEWAQSRGYTVVSDQLAHPSVRSMHDLAYVALSGAGDAQTIEQLHAAACPEKSLRSLSNQLADDPRFHRVGADRWELVEWGGESYRSIRDEIAARVDATGSASLAILLNELPARFGVAASSVRTYATSWPFQTVGDVVSRTEKARLKARPLNRTRNVYFTDGGFTWRFQVTFDHARGSGSAFPTALAGSLGNTYGNELTIPVANSVESVTLRWSNTQATISTIRSIINRIGAEEGDHVAFTFRGGEVFVERLGTLPTDPVERIRHLVQLPAETAVTRRAIAGRLGLPSDSLWHEIVENLQARKEPELIAAITEMNAGYTE